MKNNKIVLCGALICVILLIAMAVLSFTYRYEPNNIVNNKTQEKLANLFFTYEIIRYPASVEISDSANLTIGFDITPNTLNFGLLIANGTASKRQINLTTLDGKKSRISAEAHGDISSLVSFSENDFILEGDKSLYATVNSAGKKPGKYKGEIDITIIKSKWLEFFIGY